MVIKLKTADIEIPSGPNTSPFENDKLNRREFAELLTNLVINLENPSVVAIDASWGTGKTTFIKMWTQHLRNESYPVVMFNAWENDFVDKPLVALTAELTEGLRNHYSRLGKTSEYKKKASKILTDSLVSIVKVQSMGLVDLGSLKEDSELIANYIETVSLINKFKSNLGEFSKFKMRNSLYPVVIVIDELDRCRPNYAIQLLEVTKHFFSIDNVIFVLAINRRELEHSIRAIYGYQFDAQHYLSRFFDVEFNLPDADRREFVDSKLSTKTLNVVNNRGVQYGASELIYSVFTAPGISLRTVAHYVSRLNIVMASIGPRPLSEFVFSIVFALLARAVDPEQYVLFNRGNITDADFSDSLFEKVGMRNLKESSINSIIDGLLCFAYLYKFKKEELPTDFKSSLIHQRIENILRKPNPSDQEQNYAHSVREKIEMFKQDSYQRLQPSIGQIYFEAVNRIELLTPSSPDSE